MKKIFFMLALAAMMMAACGGKGETPASEPVAAENSDDAQESALIALCLQQTTTDPIEILEAMMSEDFVPMHGPIHHILSGMALLTAYSNAGGDVALESALKEMISRGRQVPGGACGRWGACGASLSCGMFMSIVTDNSPFATEAWHLSNLCTAQALEAVANHGGPRCCKRDSYLSVLSTVDFVNEHLGVKLKKAEVDCSRSCFNEQCLGEECPFFASEQK